LTQGMNLFEIPVEKIRSDFLEHMSNIKVMEIRRQLPDTLRIKIIEREPMARVGRKGGLVMDDDGYVFVKKSGLDKLPVVYGHRGTRLRPGDRVSGMTYAGVQTLDMCNDPKYEDIAISAIDVGGNESINLWLLGNKSAALAWDKMGQDSEESREGLKAKLDKFAKTLNHDTGMRQSRFDLTFDDDVYGE
jgi:hypothetical protein